MAKPLGYSRNYEYKWHAIYTRLNHEKSVEASLKERDIEVYLPKKKMLRIWSDRKKWIEEPLFRPYVFVRVSKKEYHKVLQIPSVLYYIFFGGKAAQIPDEQIEVLKIIYDNNLDCEISPNSINSGDLAKIIYGPLKGRIVNVINRKGDQRIIVTMKQISYSVLIDIDSDFLIPC